MDRNKKLLLNTESLRRLTPSEGETQAVVGGSFAFTPVGGGEHSYPNPITCQSVLCVSQ